MSGLNPSMPISPVPPGHLSGFDFYTKNGATKKIFTVGTLG